MKNFILTIAVAVSLGLMGCEDRANTSRANAEDCKPGPTPPRVQKTAEPIDPADIVKADITKQGPTLFADEHDGKKTLNCSEYNRVMVNGNGNEITISGVCSRITLNGHRNKVSAVAAAEIVSHGSENEISYSKFANGIRPIITDSSGSNTVNKISAVARDVKKK